jgi:hypothetical protein
MGDSFLKQVRVAKFRFQKSIKKTMGRGLFRRKTLIQNGDRLENHGGMKKAPARDMQNAALPVSLKGFNARKVSL